MSDRTRINILRYTSITVILAILLGILAPIAFSGSSQKVRDIILIVWGAIAGCSYLAYTVYAVWEYKTNVMDKKKTGEALVRMQRKALVRKKRKQYKSMGLKFTSQMKKEIMDGTYEETDKKGDIWR